VHVPQSDGEIPVEHFDELVDERTALVAVTAVCYRNGARLPIEEVIELAHARGALVLLDAYQAIGTYPIDVRELGVDFLGAGVTLTVSYDVTVSDGFTTSTQTVTVTERAARRPDQVDVQVLNPTMERDGYTTQGTVIQANTDDAPFLIDTVLPRPGFYKVFCDFFPVGGLPQVLERNLVTNGFDGDLVASQASLVPDRELVKTVDGMRFELKLDPAEPLPGQSALLKYHVVDAVTGSPVTDLEPYLGAWGHMLAASADLIAFLRIAAGKRVV
jgi:hypothetical protein